eukprot:gb/GECH01009694.1/.p1 GENE.gb/GECH01009694.1/~~gb/GECH01009694.1/.p1  ORF type:complete len:112 (+),score=22.51 gb/GECH01009694.1/:1-336(+)
MSEKHRNSHFDYNSDHNFNQYYHNYDDPSNIKNEEIHAIPILPQDFIHIHRSISSCDEYHKYNRNIENDEDDIRSLLPASRKQDYQDISWKHEEELDAVCILFNLELISFF